MRSCSYKSCVLKYESTDLDIRSNPLCPTPIRPLLPPIRAHVLLFFNRVADIARLPAGSKVIMKSIIVAALLPLALGRPSATLAPIVVPRNAQVIDGKYIVMMKDGVTTTSVDDALALTESTADHVYKGSKVKGFASALNATELEALQAHPDVSLF